MIENINRLTETFFFPLKEYTESGGFYTSDPITIYGLTAGATIDVSSFFGEVDAGTFSLSGSFSSSTGVIASGSGSITIAVRYPAFNVDPNIINGVSLMVEGVTGRWEFSVKDNNTTDVLNLVNLVFQPKLDVELGREITSDEVLVTGFIPNVLYVFTTSPLGGINMGVSSIIGMFGNDMPFTPTDSSPVKVAVQISNSGNVGGTKVEIPITVRATINGKLFTQSTTFYCVTKATGAGLSNFYLNSVSNVQPNTLVTSEVKEITGIQPNTTYTLSTSFVYGDVNVGLTNNLPSGSFSKSKSIRTSSSNPIFIAASVNSSSSYNTEFNVPLTLSDGTTVKTTNWLVKTMNQPGTITPPGTGVTDPTAPGSAFPSFPITNVRFANQSNVDPNTNIVSETIKVTGVTPNTNVTITTDRGLVNVGTIQLGNAFGVDPTVQTGSDGSFVMAIQLPSAGAGSSSSMSITFAVGGNYYQSGWIIVSTASTSGGGGGGDIVAPPATSFLSYRASEFSFLSIGGVDPNSDITSNTIQITNLPPNSLINITTNRGLVNVGLTQLGSTFATNPTIITSPAGIILLAVQQPSANFGQIASMTITLTVGSDHYSTSWDVTTKNAPDEALGPTSTEWSKTNSPSIPLTFTTKKRLTDWDNDNYIRLLQFNNSLGKFIVFGDVWKVDRTVTVNQVSLGGVFYSMSDDGEHWDTLEFIPSITSNGLVGSLTCGNNSMVYVDTNHGLFYSVNGTSWSKSTVHSDIHHVSVAYGAGIFIAVGLNTNNTRLKIAKSVDGGTTWNDVSLPEIELDYPHVIYANNQFFIYADILDDVASRTSTMVSTSTDGTTWSTFVKVTFPTDSTCRESYIVYGNGKFITKCSGSFLETKLSCSNDGKIWSAGRVIPGITYSLGSCDFINGKFFVTGFNNVGQKQHVYSTSTDGQTWDTAIVDGEFYEANYYFNSIAYGKNKYVTFSIYGYYNWSIPPVVVTTQLPSLNTSSVAVLITSSVTALTTTQVSTLTVAPPINLSPAPTSVINTPILCSLSLAPFVGNELTVLKEQYAFSLGSNYKSLYSNAIGKYQFSIPILKEFGYLKSDATNLANVNWVGNYGFRSRELFLDAPEHQELLFDKIMLKRYNELRAKSIDLTKFTTLTAGGMLIGASRFGTDAMIGWVNQLPVTFVTN